MSEARHLDDRRLVLTRAEVAELLHCSPRTVSRLPIPSVQLGPGPRLRRWRLEDVKQYLDNQRAA